MRLSRFVVAFRQARAGEHVLYDVVGDRYVGVDDSLLAALERGEPPAAPEAEREAVAALAEMGFLVAGAAADEERLRAHRRRSAEGMPGTTYVTWMPTLSCNLACSYCFQRDHPASGRMSGDTEAAALAFVEREVDAAATRDLVVHFIGGEPLLCREQVLRVAAALSAAMAARGGRFRWELTTNGVGLDPEFANALLATGDGCVKLTLDGDRETHDGARRHRDGRGTFEAVFGALVALARDCPRLAIRVGGNFSAGQATSYERLLDRMEAAGLRGRIDQIRFKPVVAVHAGAGCSSCAAADAEAETLVAIGRSVERRGLGRRPLAAVDAAGLCELHWKNAWVIDPAGRLYRCLDVAGRPEMALGDVLRGAVRADPLLEPEPWERHGPCRACAFLPVCGGGCLGARYLATGRTGEVLCRRAEFEKTFRDEIVARYVAEFHGPQDREAA